MRKAVLIVVFTLGLVPGAVGAAAQSPAPAPAPPLSAERVSALLPVIDDAQVLDAAKPVRAKLSRYTGACRRLPRTDVLIVAYHAVCLSEGDAFAASLTLPTCKSAGRCRARLNRYGAALGRQASASRRLNTVLKTEVTDPDCRSALRLSRAVLTAIAKLKAGAATVVKAIGGDPKRVSTAIARFYAIDRSPLLDHRGRLDTFRSACQ